MKRIATTNAPAALGPYAQAVDTGDTVYCSGQLGLDPATGALAEGVQAQTHQALKNLQAVLQEAALAGEVELRTCGCCVEVALADVVHQLVDAGPLDLGHLRFKPGDQFFLVHILSPLM